MKYADYKKENLVFLKKETDTWNANEKREFLETCPENAGLEDTIGQLKELLQAIKDGVVKENRYGEINKNSLKAYLNRNDTNIMYGRPYRHYSWGNDSKDFYFKVDGSYELISRTYTIDSLIQKYDGGGDIERRFNHIAEYYYKTEETWSKNIENERYTATNADQITANKKLLKALDSLRIEIPVSVDIDKTGYFERINCDVAKIMGYDFPYSRNNYGEVLVNNRPFTEKQATELLNMVMEMSLRINDIINEYKGAIGVALGNKGE